jgi:hypothetical protein
MNYSNVITLMLNFNYVQAEIFANTTTTTTTTTTTITHEISSTIL